MGKITHVLGREIPDSRGNPTVELEVTLTSGAQGRAAWWNLLNWEFVAKNLRG